LKVLFLGDIVGKPGRAAVRHFVPILRERHALDVCVGNSENSAGGAGITPESADDLLEAGLDLLTSGNHTWSRREILPYLDRRGSRQLRPANYPDGAPGRGHAIVTGRGGRKLGVINLEGRVFMKPLECPFRTAERLIAELRQETPCILVDMHCEATSESQAMGWHLDGRVSAVVGTHRHVQTADERVLPQGTAYITDLGMTGPTEGVIGVDRDLILQRFISQMPVRFEPAKGPAALHGAVITVDPESGRASRIERLRVPA